ncbi:hypothetical protein Hypma_014368 [Hypsizygus marmoreus]|uniref:DUF5648 domain-containing protein n=1 Tax=Hypsizygus marmoreus TaxID=39966 RepID=A0A369JAC1_HYPMA|nr:hypothetical protein Hypma_014368 [Hypsizygus marmoreus]
MKFTISLITAALVSIVHASAVSLPQVDAADSAEVRLGYAWQAKACGDPRTAVPLYRAWNGQSADHFYTTNADEVQNAVTRLGYTAEGITGYVFSKKQPATVPLYRLWQGSVSDHFYTTSAPERDNAISRLGYVSEGVVGWVYPNTKCGLLALYRSYNGPGTDHFYTMSAAEKDNAVNGGWTYEGVAGYIFPY